MRKFFLGLVLVGVLVGENVRAEEGEVIGLVFPKEVVREDAGKEMGVVRYELEEGSLVLREEGGEELVYELPEGVMHPLLAVDYLKEGKRVEVWDEEGVIKKIRLLELEEPVIRKGGDNSLVYWVVLVLMAAVLGIWWRFYERAKKT